MLKPSTRTHILLLAIALIVVISPWLGGGLTQGFVYELTLILTALALFLIIAIFHVEKKQIIFHEKKLILYFLLFFIAGGIISSYFSIRPYQSWSEIIMWLAGICIFLILSQLTTENILKKFSWLFILMGALVSIAGFVLFLISASENDLRLDSVLFNPNLLSGYLIGLWPLALCLMFLEGSKKTKIFLYFTNIILGTAYLLSVSYTGWVSILPVFVFVIIYFRQKIFTKKFIAFSILAIFLILLSTFSLRYLHTSSIEQGISIHKTISSQHGQHSFNQRVLFIKTGLKIFQNHPITGIGLGNLKLAYQQIQETIKETPRSLHNNYLDLAAETGLFGFIGFIGFILILFLKNLKIIKNKNPYLTGLFLGWCGLLIHGAVDFAWQIKIVIMHFFISSGLLYGHYLHNAKNINTKKTNKIILIIILILAILFLARGVQIFYGHNNQTQGDIEKNYKQYTAAISFYEKAWHFNKDPELLMQIGILEYTKEKYDEAKNTALSWIEKSPHDPRAYQLLGRVYKSQGQLDLAKENFEKALKLNPYGNSEIKLDCIEIYLELEQYKKLITEVDDFINIYNTQARPGRTQLHTKQISVHLAKMLDYQGEAYLALNNEEKAKQSWQHALEENEHYAIAEKKLKQLESQ